MTGRRVTFFGLAFVGLLLLCAAFYLACRLQGGI